MAIRGPTDKIDELIQVLKDINRNLERIAHYAAFIEGIFDEMPSK